MNKISDLYPRRGVYRASCRYQYFGRTIYRIRLSNKRPHWSHSAYDVRLAILVSQKSKKRKWNKIWIFTLSPFCHQKPLFHFSETILHNTGTLSKTVIRVSNLHSTDFSTEEAFLFHKIEPKKQSSVWILSCKFYHRRVITLLARRFFIWHQIFGNKHLGYNVTAVFCWVSLSCHDTM